MKNTQINQKEDKYSKAINTLRELDTNLASSGFEIYRDALRILTDLNSLLRQDNKRKSALDVISTLDGVLAVDSKNQVYRDAIKVFTTLDDNIEKYSAELEYKEDFEKTMETLDNFIKSLEVIELLEDEKLSDQACCVLHTLSDLDTTVKLGKMPFIAHF